MKCWHRLQKAVGKRASCGHKGRLRPCGERICGHHISEHLERCKTCYGSSAVAA